MSVYVEKHNAVRHSVTACCCPNDVINVLSSALLQYVRWWSAQQSVRRCTIRHCVWFVSESHCIQQGRCTKLGQTHEINWSCCAYVNAYCQGIILTDSNMLQHDVSNPWHKRVKGRLQWPCGQGVDRQQHTCWENGFESQLQHGCLPLGSVVWCLVEVSATGRSLVQRNPTDCDRET